MTAAEVLKGAWTARWANWVVGLTTHGGTWEAIVWRWRPGKSAASRFEVDSWGGFASQGEAVSWACDVMRKDGAVVMITGAPRPITLESLLRFESAPCAVA